MLWPKWWTSLIWEDNFRVLIANWQPDFCQIDNQITMPCLSEPSAVCHRYPVGQNHALFVRTMCCQRTMPYKNHAVCQNQGFSENHAIFVRTMPCLSEPCTVCNIHTLLVRTMCCLSQIPCWSEPCAVCHRYLVCQNHVLFFTDTLFVRTMCWF